MVDERGLEIDLSVDGCVNEEAAPSVVKAGADVLAMGSAVFREGDIKSAIKNMRTGISASSEAYKEGVAIGLFTIGRTFESLLF